MVNRKRLLLLIGVVIGILLLAGIILLYGAVRSQSEASSQTGLHLRAAVQATFPKFCTQFDHQLNIRPSSDNASLWEIHCDPNPPFLLPDAPWMTVDLTTCKIIVSYLTLQTAYPEFRGDLRLMNCPMM